MDVRSADRLEKDATIGNRRVHLHALTLFVMRQGSSLMTAAEARAEALRLFNRGLRASDVTSL